MRRIRWCLSHSASTPPGADWCWPWDSGYAAQQGADECEVVPMVLVKPESWRLRSDFYVVPMSEDCDLPVRDAWELRK